MSKGRAIVFRDVIGLRWEEIYETQTKQLRTCHHGEDGNFNVQQCLLQAGEHSEEGVSFLSLLVNRIVNVRVFCSILVCFASVLCHASLR
jgi:hypothetical protein